jgi:hypothetical protein
LGPSGPASRKKLEGMRIETWHLERGARGRDCVIEQQRVLADHHVDILVLTEVPTPMSTSGDGATCSPALPSENAIGMLSSYKQVDVSQEIATSAEQTAPRC